MNTPGGTNGTLTFNFTAIATEDGTSASNSAVFVAQVEAGGNEAEISPLAPLVVIGNNAANEDNSLRVNITLVRDPAETTNVTMSLVIRNLDPRLSIAGAIFNVFTQEWVISAAALQNGELTINAPADYAGADFFLEYQAVAANNFFQTNRTAFQNLNLTWFPVADGPLISATSTSVDNTATGLPEDKNFTLNISISDIDADGSETVGEWVIIEFGAGYGTWWEYEFSGASFQLGPFTIGGVTTVGTAINITRADLDKLKIIPVENWHGEVPIIVHGFTTEALDPNVIGWKHEGLSFTVTAVPDPPIFQLQTVRVSEFNRTSIAGLLSAALYDNITMNGGERMSIKLVNIPEGSQFFLPGGTTRYGGFVEPGVYSIPDYTKLATLEYLGPEYVSGNFTVTLSAITIETSNGLELITDANFTLIIEPVASPFLLLSSDINVGASGVGPLVLNVRLEDLEGSTPGENPPEVIELFFDFATTGSDAIFLRPTLGGHIENTGMGKWTFRGTEAQANAIQLVNVDQTGTFLVGVEGRTLDVDEVSALSTDDFDFQVRFTTPSPIGENVNITTLNYNGTSGNDFYRAASGGAQTIFGNLGSDIIISSAGAKTMHGGLGADQFVWPNVASLGSDIVTDFNPGQGDQLNVGSVINFDIQTDSPSDFVRLSGSSLQVLLPNGVWTNVATLQNFTSFDANALYASGNLLL